MNVSLEVFVFNTILVSKGLGMEVDLSLHALSKERLDHALVSHEVVSDSGSSESERFYLSTGFVS